MTAQDATGRGIVDLDARAVEATVSLVKQAGLEDLDRPTPCAGWSLAGLIGHMTAQHYGWIAAAVGHGADLSVWQPGPPVADPIGEYAEASRRVLEAFGADGVLDRQFALAEISPVLRFPAAQAISFHFIDYVVHGWDVARSLGAGLPARARPASRGAAGGPGGAGRGGKETGRGGVRTRDRGPGAGRPAGPDRRDARPPSLLAPVSRPTSPEHRFPLAAHLTRTPLPLGRPPHPNTASPPRRSSPSPLHPGATRNRRPFTGLCFPRSS